MNRKVIISIAAVAAGLLMVCTTRAAGADSVYVFRKGVHLSSRHPLNRKELQILSSALRTLTGLNDLAIDATGDLSSGDRSLFFGGSALARDLILTALDGDESFTIESANSSQSVAFAQLDSGLRYSDGSGRKREDWHIKIDFADFNELRGDRAAIASFDPGIAFLHELVHAVLRYADPVNSADELGDCERYLNRIRAELKLPEREHYYTKNRLALGALSQTFQGTISFGRNDGPRYKQLILTFELNKVFDSSKARPRDMIQTELLALRSQNRARSLPGQRSRLVRSINVSPGRYRSRF